MREVTRYYSYYHLVSMETIGTTLSQNESQFINIPCHKYVDI